MSGAAGSLLLVGAGGFIGAVLRYGVSGLVHRLVPMSAFPWGTVSVNASGCLLIGLLAGLADARNVIGHDLRLFAFIGLLGGFTTYSTFGYETIELLRDGAAARALGYVGLHLVAGLGAAWLGYALTSAG